MVKKIIKEKMIKNPLSARERDDLLQILKARFDQYPKRHKKLQWSAVEAKLRTSGSKLWTLKEMERTGGEPDVVAYDVKTGEYVFFDCAPETPKGRRSSCYDEVARESRKENQPQTSAQGLAAAMGVALLNEKQYRDLQTLGVFDTKTSSWLETPATLRKLGGAIFGDRRYDQVFVYHNGAESYYAGRGFRGWLRV